MTKLTPLPTMTEKELSAYVVHAARECGWLVARTWLSKFSPAGEPDLRMVKPTAHHIPGRMIWCELKSEKGKLSEPQREWLTALATLGGVVEVYVCRPSTLEAMYRMLLGQQTQEDEAALRYQVDIRSGPAGEVVQGAADDGGGS